VRRRADVDDWEAEDRAYRSQGAELEEHDCAGLEDVGDLGPAPQQVARRGPARTRGRREPVRIRKHTCACSPPRIVRSATRDLTDVVCQRCSSHFTWQPSPCELDDDTLAGRRSA
jgi:hypothetical protein